MNVDIVKIQNKCNMLKYSSFFRFFAFPAKLEPLERLYIVGLQRIGGSCRQNVDKTFCKCLINIGVGSLGEATKFFCND